MTRWSLSRGILIASLGALLLAGCAPAPAPAGAAASPPPGADTPAPADAAAPDPTETVVAAPAARSPVLAMEAVPDDALRARLVEDARRALARQRSGDSRGAAAAFAGIAADVPALADWGHLLAAEALAAAGDTAGVRHHLELAEPVRVREWAWRTTAEAYRAAGDTVGAVRALETGAPRIVTAARRAEALRALGELRAATGDRRGAAAAYRDAMDAAPQARAAREAAAAVAGLRLEPGDRLIEGRVWLRHGNVDRGVAAINAYLAAGAGSAEARAEAQLVAGRALFNARRHGEAERHLLAAARTAGASQAVAAEASLLAGRAQFRDGRRDAARATLGATADRFPRQPAAAQALFILGDLDQDAGRMHSAREHFQRAAQLGGDTPESALSAVRLAGILLLDGDARGAAAVLDRYAAGRGPDRLAAQALYWAGRAHLQAGDRAAAEQRFAAARDADPISYYGKLATDRLGGALADLELAAPPQIGAATQRSADVALFRVDFLREIGRDELSGFEMERAREEIEPRPGALYLIAEAHLQRGAPVAGMLMGREIQRSEGVWNPRLLRIVYPFPHRELIEREARRNGLDPFMVAGLIRQESMFNPIAVSPAGAIGLMQVMPATGRMLARRAGVANFEPAMLRRPELNVRLGTLFLADLLGRNPNPTLAFAAYNAGPSRAAQWRQLPEAADEELFAERIPFTETRDYVKILSFNTRLYRLLYGS